MDESFQIEKYEKDQLNSNNWDRQTYISLLDKHDMTAKPFVKTESITCLLMFFSTN